MINRPSPTDNERAWSAWLASQLGGIAEFRTVDGSRVDVLTDEHAIEVEWIKKHDQAIGQALRYGVTTGRTPAVILLTRDKPHEQIYFLRACVSAAAAGIVVWTCPTRDEFPRLFNPETAA